tara:strand:- start:1101 stop:1301 length:201 start_codon:yes stop_codon:yes gene_type:complete
MLNITNDVQVDERLVSRLDDSLVKELRFRWESEKGAFGIIYPDETFESFCVRYIVETIHDMDHMNF